MKLYTSGIFVKLERQAPQIEIWNSILVEFLSNLNVKPPSHERKVPPHERKAPLLTTFWRRFCFQSVIFGFSQID